MKKLVVILILFTIQTQVAQDFRFGKVSKEELTEKQHPKDSLVPAAVLFRSNKIHYDFKDEEGFIQVEEIVERIKIYNKEGYKYATQQIRLYDESATKRQELKGLKAYTYYLEGNEIEKQKLKSKHIFEEKVNDYWALTKFTMPHINDGVVIEFEYRVESPFIGIEDIALQYNIPINVLEIDVRTPEYFVFNKVLNPKSTFYPEIVEDQVLRTETTRSQDNMKVVARNLGMNRAKTNRTTSNWEFQEDIVKINATNVPALKKEPLTDNLNNYRAKLIMEYTLFKGPNGQTQVYSKGWDHVVKTIYESENFGGQLQKTIYFEDDIDRITQDISDPIEKGLAVFNYLKTKVKWNDFVGYSTLNGVKKAYKEGTGNTADINLMLVAMLKYVGLNASPILISTRDNGIPIIATRSGFNYVVAAIEVSNGIIMLDATNKHAAPNVLPTRALNWQGRIVREHGSSTWVNLLPIVNSKEITSINVKINKDLSIDGKVRILMSDYLAHNYRNDYNSLSTEAHIMQLEKDKGDLKISNLEIANQNKLLKPITYSYDYHLENDIEKIGDKLYFSPMLFFTPKENLFKQDTRQYPIDFMFPISEKYIVNVMLPEGYVVASIPESSKVKFNGKEGEFSYLAKQQANVLQFTINLDLNKSLILPKEYAQFKKFFELMIEKETEKVVLKKG